MFYKTYLFPIVYILFHLPDLNSLERDEFPILRIELTDANIEVG